MATNSLHFMRFELINEITTDLLSEKLFLDVIEDEDRLIAADITETIIDGYYVTYFNSKELVFNQEMDSLETVLVRKNTVVPFSINIEKNILDVWSSKNNTNKLVSQIGILLNHQVIIESIIINLEKIVSNLSEKNIKIGKIKIDNYPIESDIIASCMFDLKNHSDPLSIVKKYSKNLIQLALVVVNENKDLLTMMIYKNGSVVVYKSKEEISLETLEFIRKICVG
ncbi:MAG TPA: hypothetical protein VIK86_06280 [Candidatus Paceibacterota bacterium]